MKKIFLCIHAVFLFACNNPEKQNDSTTVANSFSTEGKKVIVYTTADSTQYRLTVTDTLSFSNFDQPLESQAFIFVDPSHSFQTFTGIGGALTDAAAETFFKLPAAKQTELMQAYYDTAKGIG